MNNQDQIQILKKIKPFLLAHKLKLPIWGHAKIENKIRLPKYFHHIVLRKGRADKKCFMSNGLIHRECNIRDCNQGSLTNSIISQWNATHSDFLKVRENFWIKPIDMCMCAKLNYYIMYGVCIGVDQLFLADFNFW